MDYKIIVDSCCDTTPQLSRRFGMTSVPLTMRLGDREYTDDGQLDLSGFLTDMKAHTEKAGSASPAPFSFKAAMETARHSFVVTLSSRLSGSYASAELGKTYAAEDSGADVHVFDSKSASAGEMLIAVKIRELISKGLPKEQLITTVNSFIDKMKTYFVLENHDNLVKNGRLNRITEKLISILNIKLIMGSDGDGNIALHAKPRGSKQMLDKLISLVRTSERPTSGENMVISHCNNLEFAKQLSAAVRQHFDFKEIFIIPTGGISTLYADDKGIIMAF